MSIFRNISVSLISIFILFAFCLDGYSLSKTNISLTNIGLQKSDLVKTNFSNPPIIFAKYEDIIPLSKVDLNKYILISSFDSIEVRAYSNVYVIQLRGGTFLHKDKRVSCNEVSIFVVDRDVKEISGAGNVVFLSGNDIYTGEKFFYDLDSGVVTFYNAKTKMDDQYYYADVMVQLGNDRYFFQNVSFTKSDILTPHYMVNAYRVWYYKNDYLLTLNNTYYVGISSFLYFPVYFQLYRYTDILSDIGVESKIGFYIQNTFYPKNWFGEKVFPRMKIKFDTYERLGEYLGLELPSINVISNLNLSGIVNLEYDKKFEEVGGRIINFIDQYGNGNYREYRTFGWHYTLNASYNVSGTSFSAYWEDLNEPFLPSKFSYRRENLDVEKLVFPYQNYFWSTPSVKQFINRNVRLNFGYGVSSFSLGVDWIYQLRSGYSTTNTNSFGVIVIETKTNKYDNSYYRYDLQRIEGPKVSYNVSIGNFISYKVEITNVYIEKGKTLAGEGKDSVVISRTNEISRKVDKFLSDLFIVSTNYITNISEVSNGIFETNYVSVVVTNLSIDTNLISKVTTNVVTNQKVETKDVPRTNILSLSSFSISPGASFSFTPSSTYRIEDGSPLEDSFNHNENVGISMNSSFLNNLFSLGSSVSIVNNSQWSRSSNPLKKKDDDLKTYTSMNMNSSLSFSKAFFESSFFQFSPSFGVSHSFAYRLTRPKFDNPVDDPYIDDVTVNSISLSVGLRLLKLSTLSNSILNFIGFDSINISLTGFSYNFVYLKSEYKYIDDKYYWTNKISNPVGVSVSFGPLLNYSVRYRIDISNENVVFLPASSSIGGGLSIKDIILKPFLNKLSYINLSYSFNFDYFNPINNNFTLSLSFGGMINDYWSFAIKTSIVNRKLFKYVREYAQRYNTEYVDLIRDIIDALNIFDINALRRTNFKNQGLSVSLTYDLYDWFATISGGVRLYKDEIKNFAFFEPYVMFEVKSKKNIGIEFPPIQPELYRLFE